jgi:DNA-binding SARP family transcriptional activator
VTVDFRILGPLEVFLDSGEPVYLPQRRHRELLSLFLLEHGHLVSTETLIDAIWRHDPPADPQGALRTRIYGLRRALRPQERIDRAGDGYVFRLGPDDTLDLTSFLSLTERGMRCLRQGDNRAAATLLQDALNLWRAPAIADLPVTGPFFSAKAERLVESRKAAATVLFDARLGLGQHMEIIGELREQVAADPAREHTWAQLLTALYRAGQRGTAIAAYCEARTALVQQFGMEPGPELTELLRRIQADEPSLHLNDSPLDAGRADAGVAAEAAAGRSLSQLPPDILDFVGRRRECRYLHSLLSHSDSRTGLPIAVLSGAPGVGKTCLAVHAAHCARAEFPDGQLYLELAGSTLHPQDVRQLLGQALRSLGVPSSHIPERAAERAAQYRSTLAGKRIMVVIDDAADPSQVHTLLPGTSSCAAIITSRSMLSAFPGASLLQLGTLSQDEAVEMLARIISPERAAAELSAAGELVTACARLPLAIRIAGAKLAARPAWSLSVLTTRLRGERRRLDELEIGGIGVRAAVAMSYRALAARPQRAFRLLALAGPNDVAEWLVAALIDETDARDVIDRLVDSSLLTPLGADHAGCLRYRLHDLLRDFATEQLEADTADNDGAPLRRVLTGYLQLAELARASLPRIAFFPVPVARPSTKGVAAYLATSITDDPLAWFASEHKLLLCITKQACAAGYYELASQLSECLTVAHYFEGSLGEAAEAWRAVLAAASKAGHIPAVAQAQLRLASVLAVRLRDSEVRPLIDDSIPVFERENDSRLLAQALYWRGHCAGRSDDIETARQDAQQGIDLARMVGDQQTESLHLRMLAQVTALQGDHETAIRLCETALAMARDSGSLPDQRQIIYELGEIRIAAGHPSWVIRQCRKELRAGFPLGYKFAEAYFRSLLGRAYHALGSYQQAVQELTCSVSIFASHDARTEHAMALYHLACSQAKIRDYPAAQNSLTACLSVLRDVRMPRYVELAQSALRQCTAAMGKDDVSAPD